MHLLYYLSYTNHIFINSSHSFVSLYACGFTPSSMMQQIYIQVIFGWKCIYVIYLN